ncbi:MAG: hypothetical protein Q7K16_04110 [Candidatus Azambacteria bacterium]|nr:hypothetical protein [Candidatus Azambacteria bacterium]
MNYIENLKQTVNLFLSNPTWDILLLLFFFVAVFIYGLVVGRNRIIVLLLASYPAALINEHLFYFQNLLNRLNIYQSLFIRAFAFFVLILLIFWVLSKSGFSRKEVSKKTGQIIFLSCLNVGLWANIIFGYALALNTEALKLAPLTKLLFGSDTAQIIWFIIPIFILYFFERRG